MFIPNKFVLFGLSFNTGVLPIMKESWDSSHKG
jgi:hypothetical protein